MNNETDLNPDIVEMLNEIIVTQIQPALTEIPFRNRDEIRDALDYLADAIENMSEREIFNNLIASPEEFEYQG